MNREAKILLGTAAILGAGAILLELTKKDKKSNFDGNRGLIRLRPTAPISPSMPITAVQYYGVDGVAAPAASPAPVAAPTASPAPVAAPTITPTTPTGGGSITPPIAPNAGGHSGGGDNSGGNHHRGHHGRRGVYWLYPYFNYPYYGLYPYGNGKSVYCMTEYGTTTVVDGCYAYESADACCKRKSRRGKA